MNIEDSAFVLYVDHQGHPAPLSLCYHATASRRLASSVDRHPPSTITEVDSAFCPQCLSFHDANTAALLGFCPRPSCRRCPLCQSVVSVAVDAFACFYKCGLCDWTSKLCNLQSTVVREGNDVTLEEVEKAALELATDLKTRTEQRNHAAEEHYKSMLQKLTNLAKDHVKGLRSFPGQFFPTVSTKRTLDGPDAWSVQSLEASLDAREKLLSSAADEPIGGRELQIVSLVNEQPLSKSIEGLSVDAILLQESATSTIDPASMDTLLPLAIPLRPRKSRRCRAELAEGRPGILVKPKLNPLEGDSSLRTGHGQWWKKDSSAIEVLPRLRVSIHASDESRHAFLLKVSNPTLGIIRLRLAASDYVGEPLWNDKAVLTPFLDNVLVDPLTQVSVSAQVDPKAAMNLEPTESCLLDPAEDSFLEIGKTDTDVPVEVSKWDAGDVLFESKVSSESPASLRLVAQRKSTAWFELVLMDRSTKPSSHFAVPLALQIQVGDGSWESSLVQAQRVEDGSIDFISFDLVIIWEKL